MVSLPTVQKAAFPSQPLSQVLDLYSHIFCFLGGATLNPYSFPFVGLMLMDIQSLCEAAPRKTLSELPFIEGTTRLNIAPVVVL